LTPINAIIAHFQQHRFEIGSGAIMNKHVSIPNNAWVLVADHSKALLIVNHGSPISPSLEVQHVLQADDNPPTRDQGTDRPGRAIAGSRRSAVEQTDLHATAGRRFIQQVAAAVEKYRNEGKFEAIVLVAPPKALSEIREAISDGIRALVVGELARDLASLPVAEIARHLAS
jgi:protein required for attachment to host cells